MAEIAANATSYRKHERDQLYAAELRAFIAGKLREGWTKQRIAKTLQLAPATIAKYAGQSMERVQSMTQDGTNLADQRPKPRTEDEIEAQRPRNFKVRRGRGAGPHRPNSPKAPPPAPPHSSAVSAIGALVHTGTVLLPDDERDFQLKVWNLRKRMLSFEEIAEVTERSVADCRDALRRRYEQLDAEELHSTDYYRRQMLEQIEDQMRAIYPAATGIDDDGNPVSVSLEAIDRMVKLMKAKTDLLGLNSPTKVDISVRLQQIASEMQYDYDDLMGIAREVLETYSALKSLKGR